MNWSIFVIIPSKFWFIIEINYEARFIYREKVLKKETNFTDSKLTNVDNKGQ